MSVRLGGTPAGFRATDRLRPFQRPMRLYLVPNPVASSVRSRYDLRLHFVGTLVPDKNGHGVLTFVVPPLASNSYTVATWCPGCAPYSRGRTFFVQQIGNDMLPRYRRLGLLRVDVPPATATCPVTIPAGNAPPGEKRDPGFHGNGALWIGPLPRDGINEADRHPDGTLRMKFGMWAVGVKGKLTIRAESLAARAPPVKVMTRPGWPRSRFRGSAFWAGIFLFPGEGCWKVMARVQDISLSFVVKVVER